MIDKSSVSEIAESIIVSNKNANDFIRLLAELEKSSSKSVVEAIEACVKVCRHWIEKDYVSEGDNDESSEGKFKEWVRVRMEKLFEELCARFNHENDVVKSASWLGAVSMLKALTDHIVSQTHNLYNFPTLYLEKMLVTLISPEIDTSSTAHLQAQLDYLNEHDDARYFVMRILGKLLSTDNSFNLDSVFILLQSLHMPFKSSSSSSSSSSLPPSSSSSSSLLDNFFVNKDFIDSTLATKYSQEKEHKKLFSSLWTSFLNKQMTPSLITNILSIIDTQVMPFMSNPLQLSDYLVMYYKMGGELSLAALGGLFVLMSKYNLEYPDFYQHLYHHLDHHHLSTNAPLRAAFLNRLDLFLTSTHLPSTLVASFIKRLSRLALTTPTTTQAFITTLIINLIIRHPNCGVLAGRKSGGVVGGVVVGGGGGGSGGGGGGGEDFDEELKKDPFDNDEEDPMKTNAMQSFLWEIKLLQSHKIIIISSIADKINNFHNCKTKRCELNSEKFLNLTYSQLSHKESKSEPSRVPIRTFDPTLTPPQHYYHVPL